jgi:Domain of unknown function (DUF3854)
LQFTTASISSPAADRASDNCNATRAAFPANDNFYEETGIATTHWDEWQTSAIPNDLIRANVRSLSGEAVYDFLFISPTLPRTNTGRIARSYLDRYRPLLAGGWAVTGVNLLSPTLEPSEWGQFKPDCPRVVRDGGKQKTIKYEAPPKTPTDVIALHVPNALWRNTAEMWGIPITAEDTSFWAWVINHPEIPIMITEGAKKAGAVLGLDYPAIALPGIFNGYRKGTDASAVRRLLPSLERLAVPGREFVIAFDEDEKPTTCKAVATATRNLGGLLMNKGCSVSVLHWSVGGKGIDDVIATFGREGFEALWEERQPLLGELRDTLAPLSSANVVVHERYLEYDRIPDSANLIGIQSPKNTGKTERLAKMAARAIDRGQKVLVLGHRRQLMRSLAARFGVDYVEDIHSSETRGVFGYALCVDSLHPQGMSQFEAEQWQDALVIVDEAEQVLWHLVNANTDVRKHRPQVMECFGELIQTVLDSDKGKIILADADLSDHSLHCIQALAGENSPRTFTLVNAWKPPSPQRTAYLYDDPTPVRLLWDALQAAEEGKRLLIHTDGQKETSTYGTRTLESLFNLCCPDAKVLRIDSHTSADPSHAAYGIMENLDRELARYDVVIASPTLETGVSIDLKGHFDAVYLLSHGVQTFEGVAQTLERLRADVPRYCWLKKHPSTRLGNGSVFPRSVRGSLDKHTKAVLACLSGFLSGSDLFETHPTTPYLELWAARAAYYNLGFWHFREMVALKLVEAGYQVIPATSDPPPVDVSLADTLKVLREQNTQKRNQAIRTAPLLPRTAFEQLQSKRNKTEEEAATERKNTLSRRYATDTVTDELIALDDARLYPKLRMLYYFTVGRSLAEPHDRERLQERYCEDKTVFSPDFVSESYTPRVQWLDILEMRQFFEEGKTFNSDSLEEWATRVLTARSAIRQIFGVTISPALSPISVAQTLLRGIFGVSLRRIGRIGSRTQRQRLYEAVAMPALYEEVLANWFDRDQKNSL